MAGPVSGTGQWGPADPKSRGVQVPRGEQKSSLNKVQNVEESMYFIASAEIWGFCVWGYGKSHLRGNL